ncbi:MAG TPA: RDD family protein [Solirubrobacteraceae bacterium]|nr:RDD family protein [Solirubrobacteraceae bacterium]
MSAEPALAHDGQPAPPPVEPRYVGLATRAISFALDAAVINLVAIVTALGASLILSLLHLPSSLNTFLTALAGATYILWSVGYFVVFWSTTGQTPGARLMQIRVLTYGGTVPKPHTALVRCAGTLLAALPLFAGFVPILFDSRRRGFQDHLARTVVVEAEQLSIAEARRAKMRARYEQAKIVASTAELGEALGQDDATRSLHERQV